MQMTLVNLRKSTAYIYPFYVFFISEVDATTQFEKNCIDECATV